MTSVGVLYADDQVFVADEESGVVWLVIPEAQLATLTLSKHVRSVIERAKRERGVLIPLQPGGMR